MKRWHKYFEIIQNTFVLQIHHSKNKMPYHIRYEPFDVNKSVMSSLFNGMPTRTVNIQNKFANIHF